MSVVIETTVGDLTVDLFTEERPIACLNFIKLCKLKYYNYNLFHTVEQGFIAQTGDPTGAGDGGSSIWGVVEGVHKRFFEAEYLPKIFHSSAGLLSLVSAGKGLVGSQFFFTLGENLTSLDGVHCVIGEVVEGHETLRKLNDAIVDDKYRPYQDIRITHTVLLDDPYPDPRGFQVPSRSPSPTAERLQNGRIAADEDIDDTNGKTLEEVQEMLAEREAKARATILEIVGDLPDADVAPPENVLFVCKLNPVTTDDDLEIIFSRFGKVKCCEVIRDKQSGDSLQYAFVEFEDQKSCEAAYFKMDNVLIDDRRIHVDFSQSVARVKWRGKGRGVDGQSGRLDFNNLRTKPDNFRRGGGDRRENGTQNDRPRMTSEERRKAREQRHREQEERDKERNRSRSRDRKIDYRKRDTRREFQEERRYNKSPEEYRRYNSNSQRVNQNNRIRRDRTDNYRATRSRSCSADNRLRSNERKDNDRSRENKKLRDHRRSRSTDSKRSRSPERMNSYNKRDTRNENKSRNRRDDYSELRDSRNVSEQNKRIQRAHEGDFEKHETRVKQKTSKSKKPRRKSSSESSSSDTDTDSSSSETSDSSSSSSSEEEKRRKKKSKSKKKRKAVKNKKKSKKHRK